MLDFLRESGKANNRKLQLFAVACCRRVWKWLPNKRSRITVDVAELYADGLANKEEVLAAYQYGGGDEAAQPDLEPVGPRWAMRRGVAGAVVVMATDMPATQRASIVAQITRMGGIDAGVDMAFPWYLAPNGVESLAARRDVNAEEIAQSDLLRDIFYYPFRGFPVIDATLRRSVATGLATGMYERRDFSQMPALAQRLETAGCTDADILAHCRSRSEHVRGCWVVDLLLGNE
jgi:hypothetical protein